MIENGIIKLSNDVERVTFKDVTILVHAPNFTDCTFINCTFVADNSRYYNYIDMCENCNFTNCTFECKIAYALDCYFNECPTLTTDNISHSFIDYFYVN